MVATDISPGFERCDLERSFALETRLGTSERSEELIYPLGPRQQNAGVRQDQELYTGLGVCVNDIVTSAVFQNGPQVIWDRSCTMVPLPESRHGRVEKVRLGKA